MVFRNATLFYGVSLSKTAPPLLALLLTRVLCDIITSMLDAQKIPLALVKEAFALRKNDTEGLIDAIWPQHVFPWELWRRAYETFWRGAAASNEDMYNIKNPPYPEMTGLWADAHANAWCSKMYGFFSELGFALPADSVRSGLDYILEETYGDSSNVFPAEREYLFTRLAEAEKDFDWNQFYPIDAEKLDAMLNEKAFRIPSNSYSFISQIFPDTMVVDKLAAVRHLLICECPFDHEVKGLTRHFVERVKAALAMEIPIVFPPAVVRQSNTPKRSQERTPDSAQESAPDETQPTDQENIISVLAALWQGKPFAAVRDAMKDEFGAPIIAYVLLEWCGATKTEAGRLLSEKEFADEKSYRNLVDDLMKKAAFFTIIKA